MVDKRCPRCNGNLFVELDEKWQTHCLQCGYIHELNVPVTTEQRRKFMIEPVSNASPLVVKCKATRTTIRQGE